MAPKRCEKFSERPLEKFYSCFDLIFPFYPYRIGSFYNVVLERDEWNMPYRLGVRNDGETFGCIKGELFLDLLPIIRAHRVKIEVEIEGSHFIKDEQTGPRVPCIFRVYGPPQITERMKLIRMRNQITKKT